jgi:hypothetical protein
VDSSTGGHASSPFLITLVARRVTLWARSQGGADEAAP